MLPKIYLTFCNVIFIHFQGLPGPGILAGLPGLLANTESGSGDGQLASVYSLITNIQALIKVAVENAKKEERTQLAEKGMNKKHFIKDP